MARRNKILVPEARDALDKLKAKLNNQANPDNVKYEVARETGIPLKHGYNGDLTTRQAGKIGGEIGGNMVRELVKMAQQSLNDKRE
ncbi:alpha/beta-type small acid-soluble spore protein [Bacillus sp. 1NLA3E]|uniref:alpha/beta-type small acid-soluble spore protein n=1 Tax=Bacillus sp. 1NLA3E TaxID=666686 RepID=UPI000247E7C6|nr:alpha/beta-type small acid-soluble spore protein [Bacillus sp. 1NLA3E]AGK52209.1 small acid-soluble spore protein alpha/beta type [Bacillus sp. 1NLA3E]